MAYDRSDRASVPWWMWVRSASLANLAEYSSSNVTFNLMPEVIQEP